MPGFTFGTQAAPAATQATGTNSPFSFNLAKTTAPTLSLSNPLAPSATTGFSFGPSKTTASTGLLATPATATSSFTGFNMNPSTSASTGFSMASFPGKPAGTAAPTGLGTTGLLGSTPASSGTGLNLGLGKGIFSTGATTSTAAAPSIFSSQPTTTAPIGLGGPDPNTALKPGGTSTSGPASDGKTLKETNLPDPLVVTVDALQKYVKEEKAVREDIARMSSKPMMKVQEDVTALRQLLSVVANGLQRNANSVEKLKEEMTQKLKNAEMAQRTKDLPAGLQYENTAPTEYFQRLVEEFEERMVMYRQQIETLDNHLAALHQPSAHTPSEILALLKKLHETFISLAAQLQQVHESVKSQKDHFLNYRRVFHGDSKNIFHRPAPVPKSTKRTELSDLAGPNPFPGTTNAAAHAMAMVHTRAQQPQGPPVTGLVGGVPAGFGASSYSGGIFGAAKPIGGFGTTPSLSNVGTSIGGVGNLFSSTSLMSSPASGGFGTPPTLGSSTTAALNLAGANLNVSANTKQPFQLQKPPQGAKRGKR